MTKRVVTIMVVVLLLLLALILVVGPLLYGMGVEVICIVDGPDGRRLERCGRETPLVADTAPPVLDADARPILIDTDMAVDDWMAILYLLQRPDVDVRAITVTGAGEAHCDPGVRNALDLANLAGRPDIPVSCGRETPLAGDHVFPASWRESVDALAGISIPRSPSRPAEEDAVSLITSSAEAAAGELAIIALGPLTNLAEALEAEPALAEIIGHIYIMGGAFSVAGNVGDAPESEIDNRAAEWNIYVDPRAAALVVDSRAAITFVPLDATNQVRLDNAFYQSLRQDRTTPEAEFVYQVLRANLDFVRSGNYYFWDPLAAAIAVDGSLGSFARQSVSIITEEGPEIGATRLDVAGYPVNVTTAADRARFKQHFLDVLNGR